MPSRSKSQPLRSLLVATAITLLLWTLMATTHLLGQHSVFRELRHVLMDRSLEQNDSWLPMFAALEFFRNSGTGMYQAIFFEQQIKFQYPPTSLLPLMAMEWFTPLSYRLLNSINVALFIGICCLVGIFTLQVIAKVDPARTIRRPIRVLTALYMMASTLLYYPIIHAVYLGQIQIWLGFLFVTGCIMYLGGRRVVTGVLFGLIVIIKPQFALFGLWALVRRDYRFLAGFVATTATFGIVSLAVFGLADHIDYLKALSFISSRGESFWANQSVNGIMHRMLGGNPAWEGDAFAPHIPLVYYTTLVTSALLIIIALAFPRSTEPEYNVLALLAASLAFSMASPITWEHHYGVLPPLFALLLTFTMVGRVRALEQAMLAAGYALTATFVWSLSQPAATPLIAVLQNHILYGAVILLWVAWRVATHSAGSPWLSRLWKQHQPDPAA